MFALSHAKMRTVTRPAGSSSLGKKQPLCFPYFQAVSAVCVQDSVLYAELSHSWKRGGMKSLFNIVCVCVRVLTTNRSESL